MAGHGKAVVFYPYLTAYNVGWKEGIDSLDDLVKGDELSNASQTVRRVDLMESSCISPEEAMIRKDLLERLSSEAKEVIQLILNGPKEVLEVFAARKYDKISKRKVSSFLIKEKGWTRAIVKQCFQELYELSNSLE